ncbi:MAG: hypothetical protein GX308_00820 [Epulopiscium sp.]|nr:hypothetical protein [Candidatus Epulonipiscium sp.]
MAAKVSDLQQKVLQKLVLLGEEVHYKMRKNELEDSKLKAISNEICLLENEIAQENKNIIHKKAEKICPKCNQPLDEGTKFCNSCGLDINKFYMEEVKECGVCKGLIQKESAFCNICGSKQI